MKNYYAIAQKENKAMFNSFKNASKKKKIAVISVLAVQNLACFSAGKKIGNPTGAMTAGLGVGLITREALKKILL